MAMRRELLAWQWRIYPGSHRQRLNLLIHAATAPLFWIGLIAIVAALFGVGLWYLPAGAVLIAVPVFAQRFGHGREIQRPEPFAGFDDFVSRFFAEQLVTFPRFVLSGGWLRNLRG